MTTEQAVELTVKLKGLFPKMTDEQVRTSKRIMAPLNEAETWCAMLKFAEKSHDFVISSFVCAVRPNDAPAIRTTEDRKELQAMETRIEAEWAEIESWAAEMDQETWDTYIDTVRQDFTDPLWDRLSKHDLRKCRPVIGAMWIVKRSVTAKVGAA